MILKKPYAFFIRIFKPIHILMAFLLIYNVYLTNELLKFFNNYIYSNENVVAQELTDIYAPSSIFIIPILLITFSLIFLGIMFYKKKPYVFYLFSIFLFLVVVVINIYVTNFLTLMEESIVAIKVVKLNHDLILISMVIEVVYIILFIIRGIGLNLKKFDFDSDITKFDVSELDKEEFEFSVNIDLDMAKRNRNKKIRHLKYLYKENKFIINIVVSLIFGIVLISILYPILNFKSKNEEGKLYSMSNFNLKVNKSLIISEMLNGEKLVDHFLVVVDSSLQTELKKISLSLTNFKLKVGEMLISVNNNYSNELKDIGNAYSNFILSKDSKDYIFVFEVPEKYIKSDFSFIYYDEGVKKEIKLNAKNYVGEKLENKVKMNEKMNLNNTLNDISFTISDVDIKDKFLIKYNYCITNNDCLVSKEYIKPSIDENFDKCVLKLNVNYINNSKLDIKNFYQLFSNFGSIYYKIGENWYSQNSNFEEIKSKRINNKNIIYIGVNDKVLRAESIKLVFNARGSIHEYILK